MAIRAPDPPQANLKAIRDGWAMLKEHPLFAPLVELSRSTSKPTCPFPKDGFARIEVGRDRDGEGSALIVANGWRRADAGEWANVLGQALLHLGLGHVDPTQRDEAAQVASALAAADFLRGLAVGTRPAGLPYPELALPGRSVAAMAAALRAGGRDALAMFGGSDLAGAGQPAWIFHRGASLSPKTAARYTDALAQGIRAHVASAIEAARTAALGPGAPRRKPHSLAERARAWFVTHYPLLGALAAAFEIIEDERVCGQLDIALAAVDSEARRIYVNPAAPWTYAGLQFAIAHEILHVGLRHEARRQGRDPFLWNVACDFVINGWLVEMGVGELPSDTLLLDPVLGLERDSAEAVYDRIVRDLRVQRRLAKAKTMRGFGKPDMLSERAASWWSGPGTDLDAFYRRALAEGLETHLARTRGLIPGDLIEEIQALQHPPIPWDVRLGQWLDAFFPPLESRRSFARASRRQAATPDIPRPVWERPPERLASRTFGVVLDTSGSMPPRLLARALGAIASYAMSREVRAVRAVQCDAAPHDMGYVEPERLLDRVEVRGRGGTVLQPGVALLEQDADFPKDAPILIITDGACDAFSVRREHAVLMPQGARLPFRTNAPIFAFEKPER